MSTPERAISIGKLIQQRRKEAGLTQEQLARKADVPYTTLTKVEGGAMKNPSSQLVTKLARALALSLDSLLVPQTYYGKDALLELWRDVLASYEMPGVTERSMCISGLEEGRYFQISQNELLHFISELKRLGVSQKLLNCEGDLTVIPEPHLEYRSIPKKYFNSNPTYVYADKVAVLIWEPEIQVVIMQNATLAETYRKQFLFLWDHAKPIKKLQSKAQKSARTKPSI